MDERKDELLGEVKQIFEQYRQEVPGKRRAWPESIKQRVEELHKLGLSYTQIAKKAGISYLNDRSRDLKRCREGRTAQKSVRIEIALGH